MSTEIFSFSIFFATHSGNSSKQRDQALQLRDVAVVAHLVANSFPEMNITVSLTEWHFQPLFVTMSIYVRNFKELTPVFQALAQAGWRTDKDRPYDDYADIERRTYNMGPPTMIDPIEHKKQGGHRLRVMAFPTMEGATCKKVQIGTKVEPVYELVCE